MLRSKSNSAKARLEQGTRAPLDEVSLIDQVSSGDIAAFETLWRSYYPRLKRFAEQITRRPHLVEEIVNDTMLVVWFKANTFNLRSKVSTWIIGIALRKSLKALERADDAIVFDPDAVASPAESGPEGQLLRQELRTRLIHALASLSPEHRAVIELTFFEGRTYREIAAITGCPVNTVKTRMFYARRALKASLADRGEEVA
jgi:RNA polymerase sigma-70 factor (ECF subfamily)